jgi:hypothetical protein
MSKHQQEVPDSQSEPSPIPTTPSAAQGAAQNPFAVSGAGPSSMRLFAQFQTPHRRPAPTNWTPSWEGLGAAIPETTTGHHGHLNPRNLPASPTPAPQLSAPLEGPAPVTVEAQQGAPTQGPLPEQPRLVPTIEDFRRLQEAHTHQIMEFANVVNNLGEHIQKIESVLLDVFNGVYHIDQQVTEERATTAARFQRMEDRFDYVEEPIDHIHTVMRAIDVTTQHETRGTFQTPKNRTTDTTDLERKGKQVQIATPFPIGKPRYPPAPKANAQQPNKVTTTNKAAAPPATKPPARASYAVTLGRATADEKEKEKAKEWTMVAKKKNMRSTSASAPIQNRPLKPIPIELRRLTINRNERLQPPQCDNQEIASNINRALAAAGAPNHHRTTKVYRNQARSIVVITKELVSAEELIENWHDLIINAARGADKGVTEVEASDAWIKLRVHGLPLRRFMGRGSEGVMKIKEDIEAENPGCKLLPSVRWLGNPVVLREKMRTGEKTASTAVITVKGRKAAGELTQHKAMIGGIRYTVDRYIAAGPDSMCEICCGWGHLQSKCAMPTMPRCAYCAGKHKTDAHQCPMTGCQAKAGQNCKHTKEQCANCKGTHGARSRECPLKKAAVAKAREERATWRERRETGGNAEHTSDDGDEGSEEEEDVVMEPELHPLTAGLGNPTTTTANDIPPEPKEPEDAKMGNTQDIDSTVTTEATVAGPSDNRENTPQQC